MIILGTYRSKILQIYNFTLIQIEDVFPENLNPVCLNKQPEGTIPASLIIDVFHLCESRLLKRYSPDIPSRVFQ